MNTFKIQTVLCVDRGAYVREVTDNNGDLVCELAVNTAESPKASKYESLIAAAPDMFDALEHAKILLMSLDEHVAVENEYILKAIQTAIRKAKGETV